MADYSNQLNQARAKSIKARLLGRFSGRASEIIVQKMTKAVEDKASWVWPFAFLLAAFNDLSDLEVIGSIPLIGDFLDIIVWLVLSGFMMSLGGHIRIKMWLITSLAGFFELIPLVDPFPTWVISVAWGWYLTQKKGQLAERGLEQLKKGHSDKEAMEEFR